jgi:hypothetical protein
MQPSPSADTVRPPGCTCFIIVFPSRGAAECLFRNHPRCGQFRRLGEQARPAWRGLAGRGSAGVDGEVQAEAEPARRSSHPGAQYGEGWLKITVRLVILPSRMAK